MPVLTALFRPHPRWLALFAILPFLLVGFAEAPGREAPPVLAVAACRTRDALARPARPERSVVTAAAAQAAVATAALPLPPRPHRSDRERIRGPPQG